jgi:hypothetical protein
MEPILIILFMLYASPLLAWGLKSISGDGKTGFIRTCAILGILSFLFWGDGWILYIRDRRSIPILFVAIYFSVWYAALVLPKRKARKYLAGLLGAIHLLLRHPRSNGIQAD